MMIASMNFLISLNLMGSLLILSASSWFSVWMGMELSSMSVPPLIMLLNSSLVSKINSWKYFMVQCYSSAIFFLSILSLSTSSPLSSHSNILWMTIILSMLFKMGILPFHGWFFHLAFSLPWTLFLILSTIQKVGPLLIISECSKAVSQSMQLDLLIGSIISLISISSLKINSIRYFMVASSIINSAWMVVSAQVSKFSFISFMGLYFLHLLILFFFMSKQYMNPLESSFYSSKLSFETELMKVLVILSMIGMPPLLGFFMKMSVVEQLMSMKQFMTAATLTLSSSIMMLLYLKMVVSLLGSMRIESLKQFKFSIWIPLSLAVFTFSSSYLVI